MRAAVCLYLLLLFFATARAHEERLDVMGVPAEQSPEWNESRVTPKDFGPVRKAFGPVAPTVRQPSGSLSGRIVYMNSGHGWTFDPSYWRLQRGTLNEMNEDYGNLDQLNFFAAYCFNAGATVVSMRPLGQQTNEVVLDNDDAGVVFAGTWSDSTSTIFYGSAGDVPYRFATLANSESATATYTPNIPVSGFYPVYTWARHGSDRSHQLYRVRHTGGESEVRVPHHMVGNGWVYLGEYFFERGSSSAAGSVVISNLRGSTNGSVVIADAVRFGNGMGTVNRGGGISGYPREDENCRYWIQANLAQGQAASLYDGGGNDESDSWSAPPKMSAEMNREQSGNIHGRIHISFHSNAGGGRGTLALITGTPTPNQPALAQLCGREVNDDLVALGSPPLEAAWMNRSTVTYTGGYSEIDGSLFNNEMDATIIEVAFHDNLTDARLMRDPKARGAVGKAAMHAVVRYMNQFDGAPLAFLPEPPTNIRALADSDGSVRLKWDPPVSSGGSGAPSSYVIYRSTNGYGFGNPVTVGNVTSVKLAGLGAREHYFRIVAINAGGESMPSEVAGCSAPNGTPQPRILVVNAFDRYDRTLNPRQNTAAQAWRPPGATGTIERTLSRRANAFDYVVQHGRAIHASGLSFDSCQNEAVGRGEVSLGDYRIVIWAAGQESATDESFSAAEQAAIAAFRNQGGHLFVSGSEIAWDLDRATGPTAEDRAFFNTHLKADLGNDSNDDSQSYDISPEPAGLFAVRSGALLDDGSAGIYSVRTPDVLIPFGAGVSPALRYAGNTNGAAAIQYDGSAGGGRVVYFGFPFETITSDARRAEYMADILKFLLGETVTMVGVGSVWRYDDSGAVLNDTWRGTIFNDAAWPSGVAQLGFGDDDEATVVDTNRTRITTYFRHVFTAASRPILLAARLKRDDGAVVYLNGTEIFRSNMPGGEMTRSTLATAAVGGADEQAWFSTGVDTNALVVGSNVIGVEIHQSSATSSDLSFDFELTAQFPPPGTVTYLPRAGVWRYRDDGVNLGSAWRESAYDDLGWPSGRARMGFGGDGEATSLRRTNAAGQTNVTFYFRRGFHVANPANVRSAAIQMTRDDGAVVYLNGLEVLRDNMPSSGINYSTFAATTVSGVDETNWLTADLPAAALVPGWNTVAVELHQVNLTSSDAGFDLSIVARENAAYSPGLFASAAGHSSILEWTAGAGAFTLVSTTNLSAPTLWAPVTNEPAYVNGSWQVTLPAQTNGSRFFRLELR